MSNIEEVGARLSLLNGPRFKAGIEAATAQLKAFNDEQARSAELAKSSAKVVADSSAQSAAAVKASSAEEVKASAAASDAAKVSATEIAAANDRVMVAQKKVDALVAAGGAATLKKAQAASSKILKWTTAGLGIVAYEGIKQWMSFQQMMSQGAIDAGLKASQLPGLESGILKISNATGLAAGGVNGLADAAYRLASAYPGLHLTNKELLTATKAAANLGVAAGQTGNMDTISRMYGALIANNLKLTQHSKAVTYTPKSLQSINSWALATTGHGDVKMGDLVSSMGTGLLPVAANLGIPLNQMGAMLDVLFPAMGASAASTRLKTALGMLAAPSTITGPLFTGTGGTALSVEQAIQKKGIMGGLGVLQHMLTTPLSAKSAANYYSQFMGPGLGTFSGGSKGKATGFIAFLKAHGFSNQQIGQAEKGGFSSVPAMADYLILHSFGAGHSGAAILQLMNAYNSGLLQKKLTGISAQETPQSYHAALRLAYAQPMRQFDIFTNKLRNLTLVVGKDVTPAFDAFLHDLEAVGKWFSHNKWALDALGIGAASVVAGAGAIKIAQMAGAVVHGGTSIVKTILTPGSSLKSLFTGSSTEMSAAEMQLRAAQLQLDAATKGAGGAIVRDANGNIVSGAEGAAGAATLRSKVRNAFKMTNILPYAGLFWSAEAASKVPMTTARAMGKSLPWYLNGGGVPKLAQRGAYDVVSGVGKAPDAVWHGLLSLFHTVENATKGSGDKQKAAADTHQTASTMDQRAAQQFATNVQIFGEHVAAMQGVLSPEVMLAMTKAGVQKSAARR